MNQVINPPRIGRAAADPCTGRVVYAPVKSLWLGGMTLAAVIGGTLTFSWDALLLFLGSTAAVLLLGHSLGMHRKLIHNSYDCPLWLEHFLVYCGVLVGMAGPYGMVRTHDVRDWAQRQRRCHPYLADAGPMLRDAWWQLHCELRLDHPPELEMEPRIVNDRFYRWLDRTWMLQHLLVAIPLYLWGGWAYVFWGGCARCAVAVTGHWAVGYFAHNMGGRTYHVEGAAAQGYNVPFAGLITMGEAWHNNHHAFPGSARMGLYKGEVDPGWWLLWGLEKCGLVWNIKLPEDLPHRPELKTIAQPIPKTCGCAARGAVRRTGITGRSYDEADAADATETKRRMRLIGTYIFLYMVPFSLLFALGLVVLGLDAVLLALIYGPPFVALWMAAMAYPGFRKGLAPFALDTRQGKAMIGLLCYGVLVAVLSVVLSCVPVHGALAGLRPFLLIAGYAGLPAALFASLVLLKAWKERAGPAGARGLSGPAA
jgi:stearoyl-CoA desaturase (delta-9 desaturase)